MGVPVAVMPAAKSPFVTRLGARRGRHGPAPRTGPKRPTNPKAKRCASFFALQFPCICADDEDDHTGQCGLIPFPGGSHLSISSIFASSATDPLSSLYAPTTTDSTASVTSTPDSGSTSSVASAATSTSVSDGAKLLKQLQDLQKSDPAEFKKVTADIAAQLQTAAQQAGGSQGNALTSLASKFLQASQRATCLSCNREATITVGTTTPPLPPRPAHRPRLPRPRRPSRLTSRPAARAARSRASPAVRARLPPTSARR